MLLGVPIADCIVEGSRLDNEHRKLIQSSKSDEKMRLGSNAAKGLIKPMPRLNKVERHRKYSSRPCDMIGCPQSICFLAVVDMEEAIKNDIHDGWACLIS